MKTLRFISILFFLVACDDIGKGYQWQGKSFGFTRRFGSIGYDYGLNAAPSPYDGGIIVVGQRSEQIGTQSDLWAIKTDSNGIMEWEKFFGGGNNDVGYDAVATSDGGFLFVGYSWSFGNKQEVYAIKTDFNGNTLWEKTYGGSMWDIGNAVIEVDDGGYLIAGHSNSPQFSSGNTDIFLIKLDTNGNVLWQKSFGNLAYPNHEWAYDIIQISDGGFILVGARDRYNEGSLNGLILRLNSEGDIIWEKELLDNNQIKETIFSVSQSISGHLYLCSSQNTIEDKNLYEAKITKMDLAGNIDWQRTFKTNGREYHQYRATTTTSNEIIFVGSTFQELSTGLKEDAFMTKIDPKGNILWSRPYGGADEDDWGWSLFETGESNLVFVGSTKSFGSSLFDIFLVGTNADGVIK